ncbi:hypothetical protein LJR029_006384 [Caballeronia sp. LjRoot29]|uniref:hypothetical protein n=1 Tax=Caballeronia sp. LjRoot29 TaxID=3342315 RepID=UPI003ECCE11B
MNAFLQSLLTPSGWLFIAATTAGVAVMIMGPCRYLRYGWAAKRKDIMGGLDRNARYEYFKRFAFDEIFLSDADIAAEFDRFYRHWYGRRFFAIPLIVHTAITFIFVSIVLLSVLSRKDGLNNPFLLLPFPAIAAVTGAYMWVTNDFISRARRLDFTPADVAWGTLRLVVAIPMGYAFNALAADKLAPFVAFALGAFPLSALLSILQRRMEKQFNVNPETIETADSVAKLEGVDRDIRERLGKEDISTITQIAYCDPIRLAMRSNLSFIFISDLAGQAIAWLYLREKLSSIKPFGLRGACEIRWYLEHYNLPNTGLSLTQRRDRERAILAMPSIAKMLGQDESTVLICFKQIAYDPFTAFYTKTWINPEQPTIGFLQYGALDNHLDEAYRELVSETVTDDIWTPFRAEFVRCSHSRAGAPILAPADRGGARVPARILVLKRGVDLKRAMKLLIQRETRVMPDCPPVGVTSVEDVNVRELLNFHGLPLVLYVTFHTLIQPLNSTRLATLAIESATHFSDGDRDGISYLNEAIKAGIKTPLIASYKQEILKQTGCKTLEEALASVRRAVQ